MKSRQDDKARFRATARWKKFRSYLKSTRKLDEVTLKPLNKMCNCHHLDQRAEHYTELEDVRFSMLNKQTHETLHFLYRYYVNDKEIITRLENLLKLMVKYSND